MLVRAQLGCCGPFAWKSQTLPLREALPMFDLQRSSCAHIPDMRFRLSRILDILAIEGHTANAVG